jgi:thiamine biosynthesis lipoprotein
MKRRRFVAALGAGLAGAFLPVPLPPLPRLARARFVERWSWAMGQAVHVMVFADSEDQGLDACARALAELRRVEARLSLFDAASDLCELNRRAGRGPMRADVDLRAVVGAAERLRQRTAGLFNVAVEPLMRIWGFHPLRTGMDYPDRAAFRAALDAVTTATVRLGPDRIELPNRHTLLDLGGIAVGYGIDCAAAVLRAHGIRRAFIDVSGDCYGLGAPPGDSRGWVVRIADSAREVRLRDAALATSSNLHATVRLGVADRLGHIMDPRTGHSVAVEQKVSVVAATALAADALSTGALVRQRAPAGVRAIFTRDAVSA